MSPRPVAVVCVSGGMDSAVTAAVAAQEHELAFLHADYGQRTEAKERECFERLADTMNVHLKLAIDLSALRAIGGSSLTDARIPVREGEPVPGVIPSSYVPFRNAHLLAAATSWAETLAAEAVYVGAVWEDSSGYPDCRPEFYEAFQRAIATGTRPETQIRIVTPVIRMGKADIVRLGLELGVPFELTWSCYQDGLRACGLCESCRLRLAAFREAGCSDPISYRAGPKP